MAKYNIKCTKNMCIEMSKPNSSILIYKFPYKTLKSRQYDIEISNRFIVYILFGKNENGKDIIYVGKSKNGIDTRPAAHEDKNSNWTDCYILTNFKERTFFNDGTIQYLEDKIRRKIDELGTYINTTNQTIQDTANHSEKEDCNEFLDEAYKMLYVIGLDLISISKKTVEDNKNISNVNRDISYEEKFNTKIAETNMQPVVSKIYNIIKEDVPDIELIHKKEFSRFSNNNTNYIFIHLKKNAIRISFPVKYGDLVDENDILKKNSDWHINNGKSGYVCDVSTVEDVEKIRQIIKHVIKIKNNKTNI